MFFIFNRHIRSYMDAFIYKYFSSINSLKEVFFNISVVLTVRFRTQNVRFRTFFCTPIFSLFTHYQQINTLARFLLYNIYSIAHLNIIFEA